MILMLDKARRDGKYLKSAVKAEAITGMEPAKVKGPDGKFHNGTRIFTAQGDFYVLNEVSMTADCWEKALTSASVVDVPTLPTVKHLALTA
jgi:hypothetical protein